MNAIPVNPCSQSALQRAQDWVKLCRANHLGCHSTATQDQPRRLLDVGTDSEPIRLVETSKAKTFIALSHCWGKKRLLKTTKAALPSMAKKVPFDSLSATFQHAVEFTRIMNIRYLWIDSLCITQDDSADWKTEAAKMATIYADALLVISASAASDGEGGLFFPRTQQARCRVEAFSKGSGIIPH